LKATGTTLLKPRSWLRRLRRGGHAVTNRIVPVLFGVEFWSPIRTREAWPPRMRTHHSDGLQVTEGLGAGPSEFGRAAAERRWRRSAIIWRSLMWCSSPRYGRGHRDRRRARSAPRRRGWAFLTVGVVTKPLFLFEGGQQNSLAEGGIGDCRSLVDTRIIIPPEFVPLRHEKTTFADDSRWRDQVL